jgi:F0F1-type ATP synthase membrane subunit c/vacuolar-type H+-ATPase subunit K
MPLSQFADPTAAIEPPPQESDFDTLLQAQAILSDPFGMSWADVPSTPGGLQASSSSNSKSWTDIFTGAGQTFLTDLAKAIGGKAAGYNPNDPAQVAALAAARQREAQAEQQKTFLIVGGVAAAVIVGALVFKGRR